MSEKTLKQSTQLIQFNFDSVDVEFIRLVASGIFCVEFSALLAG